MKTENIAPVESAENIAPVESAEKTADQVKKVKVSDLIIKLITEASYIQETEKNRLLTEISALTAKVTSPGRSQVMKSLVYDAIKVSGLNGITKGKLLNVLVTNFPELAKDADGEADTTYLAEKLFMLLQPVAIRNEKLAITFHDSKYFFGEEVKK